MLFFALFFFLISYFFYMMPTVKIQLAALLSCRLRPALQRQGLL